MSTRKNYRVTVEVVEWSYKEQYGYNDYPHGDTHPAGVNDWKALYQQSFTELDVTDLVKVLNTAKETAK